MRFSRKVINTAEGLNMRVGKFIRGPVAAIIIMIAAVPVHAYLLKGNYSEGRDPTGVTIDSATGLEWLDFEYTKDMSYDDVMASSYVVWQGFRYATGGEVKTLFDNAGINLQMYTDWYYRSVGNYYEKVYFNYYGAWGSDVFNPGGLDESANKLLSLMGCMYKPFVGLGENQNYDSYECERLSAASAYWSSDGRLYGIASISTWAVGEEIVELTADGLFPKSPHDLLSASFLVRAVPEPSTGSLLMAPILALLMRRRRISIGCQY